MSRSWPGWDEWLASLDDSGRAAAELLRGRFEELGASDAQDWARSEIAEGIPQLARFLMLRRLWSQAINVWQLPNAIDGLYPARRLVEAGADRDQLLSLARAAAYEAVFAVIHVVDEGHDPEAPNDYPGWRLVEVEHHDEQVGRELGGLHEIAAFRRSVGQRRSGSFRMSDPL